MRPPPSRLSWGLTVRRSVLALSGVALAAAALTGFAPAAGATLGESCVSASQATYRHRFDGPGGTVTISAVQPLCKGEEQAFSLISYTTTAASGFVYDTGSAWIDNGRRSVTLDVAVPGCRTEVDAIFGTGVVNEITAGSVYGDRRLGSARGVGSRSAGGQAGYNGGSARCTPQPSVTFQSYCDGVLHTRLANAPGANVDASFVVGGKRIRVKAGKHADLTARPSGAVEVRDNNFRTSSGSWSRPTGCTPPATSPEPGSTPTSP